MSTKVAFLCVSFLIVLAPMAVWQVRAVRRVVPLAVLQIVFGVLLGPSVLGQVAPSFQGMLFTRPVIGALDGAATLGVLLYVFVTGLHLQTAQLRHDFTRLASVASGSVLVPLGLGLAVGWWLLQVAPELIGPSGSGPGFMGSVAICVAVTALPVLAAVLQEMELLPTRLGQTALAVAAINDAALWIMLAVLLAFTSNTGLEGGLMLAGAILWFSLLAAVAKPAFDRLDGMSDQAVLALGVALAILSGTVSEALGTGYIIGAFGAGAVLPRRFAPRLLLRLEMAASVALLPFFFMSTGLKALIEPGSASFAGLTVLLVAATIVGKVAGTTLPARQLGFSWADSAALGAMMQTKGLMEVVVLTVLQEAGLISTQLFSAMVAMAVICTVLTAPAVRLCRRADASLSVVGPRPT